MNAESKIVYRCYADIRFSAKTLYQNPMDGMVVLTTEHNPNMGDGEFSGTVVCPPSIGTKESIFKIGSYSETWNKQAFIKMPKNVSVELYNS